MSITPNLKCTIYGIHGTGTRLMIELSPLPVPIASTTLAASPVATTRKAKSVSRNIKPTNGNKLALRIY